MSDIEDLAAKFASQQIARDIDDAFFRRVNEAMGEPGTPMSETEQAARVRRVEELQREREVTMEQDRVIRSQLHNAFQELQLADAPHVRPSLNDPTPEDWDHARREFFRREQQQAFSNPPPEILTAEEASFQADHCRPGLYSLCGHGGESCGEYFTEMFEGVPAVIRCSRVKGHAGLHVACGSVQHNVRKWASAVSSALQTKIEQNEHIATLIADEQPRKVSL